MTKQPGIPGRLGRTDGHGVAALEPAAPPADPPAPLEAVVEVDPGRQPHHVLLQLLAQRLPGVVGQSDRRFVGHGDGGEGDVAVRPLVEARGLAPADWDVQEEELHLDAGVAHPRQAVGVVRPHGDVHVVGEEVVVGRVGGAGERELGDADVGQIEAGVRGPEDEPQGEEEEEAGPQEAAPAAAASGARLVLVPPGHRCKLKVARSLKCHPNPALEDVS